MAFATVTCPGMRTARHTIYIGVAGLGSSGAVAWDRDLWWARVLETVLSLGEWKRTKKGHFLLYTRELESGQVLRPKPSSRPLSTSGMVREAGVEKPGLLYIFGSSTGHCNANQLSLPYYMLPFEMPEYLCMRAYWWACSCLPHTPLSLSLSFSLSMSTSVCIYAFLLAVERWKSWDLGGGGSEEENVMKIRPCTKQAVSRYR